MADRVGQQLGNYRLTRLLGKGGFAEVYLGEHIYLNTQAAIKVLHASLTENTLESFLTEARLLSHLVHPHIIRVLEFGVQGDEHLPFLVMDYAPNGTLRQLHPRGVPLPLPTVISYVKQIASALEFAHEHNLIHRDIKPENMLLGRNYEVLLSDFGIALVTQNTGSANVQEMLGTMAYMAPEQIRGKPRPASDQYALGIVVYEWLSGKPPFTGSVSELFSQHLFSTPAPLQEINPEIPPTVDSVVMKALHKDPHQRYHDISAFAVALEEAGNSEASMSTIFMPPLEQPAEPAVNEWKERFFNLPEPLTSLVGREQENKAACSLLIRPEVRLLTLTGPGGVGKTRLALKIAADIASAFEDGICFVPLASLSNPDLVIPTIAQTFGIRQMGDGQLLTRLKQSMLNKHLLLILDNFEQVVTVAPVLAELLTACIELKILVTSRAVLHISVEHEFPVPPLTLPDLRTVTDSDALSNYSAIALFVERARTVKPHFQLTNENAPIIARICTELDGLPLAIELAAARIKLLPPQGLLARLSHRLHILTGGSRDVPARQQTLRNLIAWSYDLLNNSEKRLFRQLSVFVGGCTVEAVEEVCSAPHELEAPLLDDVTSLLDKSLLQLREQVDNEPRLQMLGTIREYALERLATSQEMESTQRAHALFYLKLAERAEPELMGTKQTVWLEQLEQEHGNMRASLQWILEHNEAEMAMRLGKALWWFWSVRGYVTEGRQWLERAITISNGVAVSVRAIALDRAGVMAYEQNDHLRAISLFENSLALFRNLEDKRGIAISLYRLGLTAWALGKDEESRSYIEKALAIFKEEDDKGGVADSLLILAYISANQRDYATARAETEESLALFREAADMWGIAYTLIHLARVTLSLGDVKMALSQLEESYTLSKDLGYKGGIVSYLEGLAAIAAVQEQWIWATRFWGVAAMLRELIGLPLQPVERSAYENTIASLHSRLGKEAFELAWLDGQKMTPEQAIAVKEQALLPMPSSHESPAPENANPPSILEQSRNFPYGLTGREVEVFRLVAQGLTNAQIAERLFISTYTVNAHLRSIYNKLNVSSRALLISYAHEHKLL